MKKTIDDLAVEMFIKIVEEQFPTASKILKSLREDVSPAEAMVALMIALVWLTKGIDADKENTIAIFSELFDRIVMTEMKVQ